DKKYVTSWKFFRFLPRAKKAIALLTRKKYKIFISSNQAGVGKKVFSRHSLDEITQNMLLAIRKTGGDITGVYYCIHRKEKNCSCRKPRAGLIHRVKAQFPVNLKKSYFIGDTIRDVLTAKTAGCKSILVFSGKEKLGNKQHWEIQPDFVCRDLFLAAKLILKRK
ncbi:MAG: HAD-IIIA family hydrolase, partial [Candidatus Omnitrophica bacterium]|nr:HAD-IIIA family hydrolase [Candidatus Omnitrophota bacterium]